MSANHAAFNLIFRFVENYVSPIAGRISSSVTLWLFVTGLSQRCRL